MSNSPGSRIQPGFLHCYTSIWNDPHRLMFWVVGPQLVGGAILKAVEPSEGWIWLVKVSRGRSLKFVAWPYSSFHSLPLACCHGDKKSLQELSSSPPPPPQQTAPPETASQNKSLLPWVASVRCLVRAMRQTLTQRTEREHTLKDGTWCGLQAIQAGLWKSLQMQAREALQCCKQSFEGHSGGSLKLEGQRHGDIKMVLTGFRWTLCSEKPSQDQLKSNEPTYLTRGISRLSYFQAVAWLVSSLLWVRCPASRATRRWEGQQ